MENGRVVAGRGMQRYFACTHVRDSPILQTFAMTGLIEMSEVKDPKTCLSAGEFIQRTCGDLYWGAAERIIPQIGLNRWTWRL